MPTNQINLQFKDKFYQLISQADSILITSHSTPDDDSIGSVLATYSILSEKYPDKKVDIVYSKDINQRWGYFQNFNKIQNTSDIAEVVGNYDLTILLDGCEYSRFSSQPDKLKNSLRRTICIDHHANPPSPFDLLYVDSNAASCSELIYQLFAPDIATFPKHLAEYLLLGILGDSGNLEYIKPSQAYVFPIVQRLVVDGDINIQELKSHYTSFPYKTFTIIQELVKNSEIKDIPGWPKLMISFLDRKFIEEHQLSDVETSSASHITIQTLGKSITEASWVIYAIPKKNGEVNFNSRSRPGSVSVKDFMQQMGIGGGHIRAAGGSIKPINNQLLDPKICLDKIFTWMEDNPPVSMTNLEPLTLRQLPPPLIEDKTLIEV